MMTDSERIAALERRIEELWTFCEALTDSVSMSAVRVMALQGILERGGPVTRSAVTAKMQELELYAEAELELSPENEQFRDLRRQIREAGEEGNP